MHGKSILAALLSLIIPGLGQIYKGNGKRGATILAAAIVIGNLNIIILPLIALANPTGTPLNDVHAVWAYWIPRVGHDLFSLWSIAFWVWAIIDAWVQKVHHDDQIVVIPGR